MRLAWALAGAALALWPASARADSIVYRRDGAVWIMAPDGSGQRAVTHGERSYAWPSAADDGTLLASDGAAYLYRLTPRGEPLGAPIPTVATTASDDLPADPATHPRLSPDGTRIAYDEAIDDEVTTLWTDAGATILAFPGQSAGQEGLGAPSWIGSDRLLLSRDLTAVLDGPDFALYGTGGGDNTATDWFSDPDATWASDLEAAASRAGTRIAVLEHDAAFAGGVPSRVVLRLYTATAPGAAPQARCSLPLEARDTVYATSPTFSPDGTRVAFAQSDGIHVADLGDLKDCGAIRQRVVTPPGAWEPFWGAAGDRRPGATTGSLTLALAARRDLRRTTLLGRGVRARVTVSAPADVRLALRLSPMTARAAGLPRLVRVVRRHVPAGTTALRVRLRPRAVRGLRGVRRLRLTLAASAPGAARVALGLSPRR